MVTELLGELQTQPEKSKGSVRSQQTRSGVKERGYFWEWEGELCLHVFSVLGLSLRYLK